MKQSFIISLIFIGVKLGANASRLYEEESVPLYEDYYQTEEEDYMESPQDYMDPFSGEENYQVEDHFGENYDEEGEYEDEDKFIGDDSIGLYPPPAIHEDEDFVVFDMCMKKFLFYWELPSLNPYCCRMLLIEDRSEGVVAFEDFCNSNSQVSTYLDICERQFTNIECGVFAQSTYYHIDLETRYTGSATVCPGEVGERPEGALPYYLEVISVESIESEILIYDSPQCSGQHYKKVDNYSGKTFNRVENEDKDPIVSIWVAANSVVSLYEKDYYQGNSQTIVTNQSGLCVSELQFTPRSAQIKDRKGETEMNEEFPEYFDDEENLDDEE